MTIKLFHFSGLIRVQATIYSVENLFVCYVLQKNMQGNSQHLAILGLGFDSFVAIS